MKHTIYILIIFLQCHFCPAQSSGGTLSTGTIVCAGANNGLLSVSGFSGSITRWEYANNSSGPWTPIVFTASSYNYINLLQSTYFRVIVQLTGYAEAGSNIVLISCDDPSIGGTVLGNTFQCINSPATVSLSASNGSVLSWEYSSNSWITTNTITTTNTLIANLSSLTNTTQIRAKVKNGACPSVFSNTITVNPAATSIGGNISGTQSVCALSNAATLSLNNYTGTIQNWESATSIGGPFNLISTTSNTLSFTNLSQSTWYRAFVKNGTCASASSSVFAVNVDQPSVGGSIVGTQNVCASINNGTLQLVANSGSIMQWQISTTNGASWNTLSNTTNFLSFSNLTTNCIYKVNVQNGLCPSVSSGQFTVIVNPNPLVGFNVNSACAQASNSFSNTSTGSNSYIWDFGDGASANIVNPSHSYLSSGTFTVKLIAISAQNCIDSLKQTLSIYPKPIATYVSADTACFGSSLSFINSSSISSGSISQLNFSFGDGSPNATISPTSHHFASEGVYSVFLKVLSNFGCTDSSHKLISIYPKPNTNFSALNVCKGSPVVFNNLSLLSNGALQHLWNFGNSYISNLPSPNYTYQNAGTYTVSLISNSNHNCKDTIYKAITINEKPAIVLTASNACLGSAIQFNSSSSPANISLSLTLNFGDGSSTSNQNPSHIYFNSGTFVSSITAVSDSGCISSAFKNLTVYSKPYANFNFNNVCSSDSASFANTSSISNGALNYIWDLSNSYTCTSNSPKYLYSTPGNYSITLIAKNEFDCSDTITKVLSSYESPKTGFIFNNSCDGFPISFTNTSSASNGTIKNNSWQFGDNSTSSDMNPVKEYLKTGTYTVTLKTESNEGCFNSDIKIVNVYEGPIANFTANAPCLNKPTQFNNSSFLSSGTYSSSWAFGDTEISTQNSPQHLYTKSGNYLIKLKITSNNNCIDSITRFVETLSLPKIVAQKDTSIEKGFGVYLAASGGVSYNWFPATGINDPTNVKPFFNPDISSTYIVEGTDLNGCKSFDTLHIDVKDAFVVIPYNVLTPDENGLNDAWFVKNIQSYPENSVVIFDQWNQSVYSKEGYTNDWEGKNMKGEILPDATYYYILRFKNNPKVYSGFITLMKNGK